MKRLLILALLGFAATASADGEGGKPLSPEERQLRQSIVQKYDANKDGVLDKTEFKSLSKEDKRALAKTGGVGTVKKGSRQTDSDKPAKELKESKESKKGTTSDKSPKSDSPVGGKQKTSEPGGKKGGRQ